MGTTKVPLSRWQIFNLTFIAYAALHSMRMGYAQIKPEFRAAYQQSHLYMGLFDAAIYLSLGIGFFLRFKFETKKNLIRTFFVSVSISSIAYLYIPISHLLLGDQVRNSLLLKEVLPGISLLIFGFCQFPAWPTLLTIINHHFDVQRQGSITGAWSASGAIGNIIGLILSGVLITMMRVRWEILMLIAGTLCWSAAFLVYLYIEDNPRYSHSHKQLKETLLSIELTQDSKQTTQFDEFIAFSKKMITKQENRLYLQSMALLKSILYGFLMWMPTYLTTKNYSSYKSTVPIAFQIGAMIGSYILGYFYHNIPHEDSTKQSSELFNNLKIYSLFYSCLAVTTLFTVFYFFNITIFIYFVLSTFCGAFLGGCFNMLASNEVIALVKGDPQNVNRLSTLSMVVGNLTVGVVQIIIGVMLNLHGSSNQNMLFIILFAIGLIAMRVLYKRSQLRQLKQQKKKSQSIELQIVKP